MEELTLSQVELAKRLRVGQGLVSNVCAGIRTVPPAAMVRWARALRFEPGSPALAAFEEAVHSGLAHAIVRGHPHVSRLEAENVRLKGQLAAALAELAKLRNERQG